MAEIGFKSDKGIRRKKNEDAFFVVPEQNVFFVADGVGGANAGEIASRTAVSQIAEYLRTHPLEENAADAALKQYFWDCLEQANRTIFELSRKYPENTGMATTIALLYLAAPLAYIVNVGDSRVYLYRDGGLTQITEDHTHVNELLKSGRITKEQARFHEQKNVITRAIGGEPGLRPDFFRTEVKAGDILLLCTDGLYGEVDEETICRILSTGEPMTDICGQLVSKANQCGGRDNITVICVRV